jgi:hypothetical protein
MFGSLATEPSLALQRTIKLSVESQLRRARQSPR